MGYCFVRVSQRKRGDVKVPKIQQARADHAGHARHGFRLIHPFAAHRNVVAHDPRIRQVESLAAKHVYNSH